MEQTGFFDRGDGTGLCEHLEDSGPADGRQRKPLPIRAVTSQKTMPITSVGA